MDLVSWIISFLLNFLCEVDSYESASRVYELGGLLGSHESQETLEYDNLATFIYMPTFLVFWEVSLEKTKITMDKTNFFVLLGVILFLFKESIKSKYFNFFYNKEKNMFVQVV